MVSNNIPPVPQPGQQQAVPLSAEMITLLAQRIIQMTQTFGCMKLTNGNGSNFWGSIPCHCTHDCFMQ